MSTQLYDEALNVADLLEKLFQQELLPVDVIELQRWIEANDNNQQLFNDLTNAGHLNNQLIVLEKPKITVGWQRMQQKMDASRRLYKSNRTRWWWAAAAILGVGSGILLIAL